MQPAEIEVAYIGEQGWPDGPQVGFIDLFPGPDRPVYLAVAPETITAEQEAAFRRWITRLFNADTGNPLDLSRWEPSTEREGHFVLWYTPPVPPTPADVLVNFVVELEMEAGQIMPADMLGGVVVSLDNGAWYFRCGCPLTLAPAQVDRFRELVADAANQVLLTDDPAGLGWEPHSEPDSWRITIRELGGRGDIDPLDAA